MNVSPLSKLQLASAPDWVANTLLRAEQSRASDIHLHMVNDSAEVSFRIDGVLVFIESIKGDLAERIFGRIKFLAQLKTYQESLPQDGRIAKEDVNTRADLRVSTYPTVTGEKLVIRMFAVDQLWSLDKLGFEPALTADLRAFLTKTSGLMLLTGPAGTGKTTTIYSCLMELIKINPRNVVTIEDPVERILPRITQTEINEPLGLTFQKAAKHLLRQDPEVLVIGEIRDAETARLAIQASLTGHLVISTLHAGTLPGVVERLLLLAEDSFAATSSLELVINQRLVRKLCPACQGKGCTECASTGFKGRLPVAQWVSFTDQTRRTLRTEGPHNLTSPSTLRESASRLVFQGATSESELKRVLG